MRNTNRLNISGQSIVFLAALLAGGSAMSLEKPEYTVLYRDADIEYRQYEPYLVAETVIRDTSDYDDAGSEGFRRLFRYISGANASQTKVAMTAPVERSPAGEKIEMTAPVQQGESADGWRVSFMLPGEYSLETAPIPSDDRVRIRTVPGRLRAVLRYSGRWTEKNFRKRRDELRDGLAAESIRPLGEFQSAAYNPPFMPPFLRRNEVIVEVDRLPASADQALPEQTTGS
jgi:hypothetical protein